MAETFTQHGLSAAGFDVLATLRRSPSHTLSPGELMATMMITSGTMTHRIDQLVRAGLITRTSDPQDARRALIALTDDGFARIDAAIADHVETQKALLQNLTHQEVSRLDSLLRKLMAASEPEQTR